MSLITTNNANTSVNKNREMGVLIFELFCEWYDIKSIRMLEFRSFSEEKFTNLWRNWWFAKKGQQAIMDAYLDKYKPLFSITDTDSIKPEGLDKRTNIIWTIGWLILWDQIPRNIYRNSAQAYATDKKARQLVEEIMPLFGVLPIPIRVSIILVFIHSENMDDLATTGKLLEDIKVPMQNFPSVWTALSGIARNHYDRMTMFGRIPERNKFLGRESTQDEINYMKSIYF
jgi:uncharacterized protein (DUF924 family)